MRSCINWNSSRWEQHICFIWVLIEVSVQLAVVCAGAVLPAVELVVRWGGTSFYQYWTPESVYWACGHGWLRLAETPPALLDFLQQDAKRFDCTTLPEEGYGPPGNWAGIQPAFTLVAGLLWRISGVTQEALLPLVLIFVALYGAGLYVLSRLFLPRWLAVACGAYLALSPVANEMVLSLRDYSKAPLFIWTFIFLICAIRQPRPLPAAGWAIPFPLPYQ